VEGRTGTNIKWRFMF
jgi:hypothetical protein